MTSHNLVNISSSNVRGLHDPQKRKDVFHYLRGKNIQICCLQETHFTESLEPYIQAEWGGNVVFNSYTSNSKGVCILFNNNLEYKIVNTRKDAEGNFILLDLITEDKKLTLVTIYGPNDDQPDFFRKVADSIEDIGNDTCVICGDFNVVQDQDLDTFNYLHVNNPKSKEGILAIKEELNLIDPYRELNESEKKITWRRHHPLKQARLGYFLISENFMPSVQSHNILPSYRSDHSTVILSFQINDFKRGSGLWKFNNSLLRDREYINIVKDCIQQVKEQYMLPIYDLEYIIENEQNLEFQISDQLFLETLLMEIRGKTISYSSFKKKQNNLKEHNLEEEIKHLENIELIDLEKINEKKLELEKFRKEKIQGIMVRAKIKWAEEGEKPTRYFCSLESRNYVNITIPKVQQENGNTIKTQEEILKEVQKFYSNLYAPQNSEKDINDQDILKNLQHPVLTDIESSNLEGEITADEISNVLRNMKNNKSPGSDGFTVEFFKFFFKDFKHFIGRSINEGYQKGTFSVTQRQGIITCLPKGDKPRQFLKNWRPITLLNVIYKIASGCIAQRLKSVLPKLISSDQTGFLSGRYIGENTRLI